MKNHVVYMKGFQKNFRITCSDCSMQYFSQKQDNKCFGCDSDNIEVKDLRVDG